MNIVIIGLSVTSSWGNGHATTYRSLIKELSARGHTVLFLEKDVPYYAASRDMPEPPFCELGMYRTTEDLKRNYRKQIRNADLVITGSYVQDGTEVGDWVISVAQGITAFYDIDTPVTLAKLKRGDFEYIHPGLIPQYDLYLSFSGGPVLDYIEEKLGSPSARAFYCSADPDIYHPLSVSRRWDIGYLGTYSKDRQPAVEMLLGQVARRYGKGKFVVAGAQYPEDLLWPSGVERIEHLPPREHCRFYNAQRFTLNVTRADMIQAGYSPSVRLFEAAACGVPVISDVWPGIEDFFIPGKEILLARNTEEVLGYLRDIPEDKARQIGENARKKVLKYHTAKRRVLELEKYVEEVAMYTGSAPARTNA